MARIDPLSYWLVLGPFFREMTFTHGLYSWAS